jgi:dihydroorotate dehydrogenase
MRDLYALIRPALFCLRAEDARELALWTIKSQLDTIFLDRSARDPDPAILAQSLWGLKFSNPIGLAAGFDKDARVLHEMRRWGFGFVEVGTVTPRRQRGNPKPRVFRLEEDDAIVNRMGFNNDGLDLVVQRLLKRTRSGIVGLNLGKNQDTQDAGNDYVEGIRRAAGLVDYIVVNVSSPNTPGLRDLQQRAALYSLLSRLLRAREETASRIPLLVKIAPDLDASERQDVAQVALDTGIEGIIVANTTVARLPGLKSKKAREPGGLSGAPLFGPSSELLADMHRLTGGRVPLVGVGGISSAADAYAKIRAGASLVQIHTALVFSGPNLVTRIKRGLAELLRADGFGSIAEAVGTARDERPTGSAERAAAAYTLS